MENTNDLSIEIADSRNMIRIEARKPIYPEANSGWLECYVTVKGNVFSGSYRAEILLLNFSMFKEDLANLLANRRTHAHYVTAEDQLFLGITRKGPDEYEVEVTANEMFSDDAYLIYKIKCNRATLETVAVQTDKIIGHFSALL
jgi:hypothetical protein